MDENALSYAIVSAAIEVHKTLGGPGLLESVYEEALVWELTHRGFKVEQQKLVSIRYKEQILSSPLRLDLMVNELELVECKALNEYNRNFEAQLLTCLRLMNLRPGLVINFGEKFVANGVHRVANKMPD